jgi:hypothetical protein
VRDKRMLAEHWSAICRRFASVYVEGPPDYAELVHELCTATPVGVEEQAMSDDPNKGKLAGLVGDLVGSLSMLRRLHDPGAEWLRLRGEVEDPYRYRPRELEVLADVQDWDE